MSVVLPPQLEQGVVPVLEAEVENRLIMEVAQEIADELHAWTKDTIENPPSPAVKLKPREQFERFMMNFVQVYPNDPELRMMELEMILNVEYIDLYREAMMPAPSVMPWAGLTLYPFAFRLLADEFRALYKEYAGVE